MSIEKQLELLHGDGYFDSEDTLRGFVSGKVEVEYMKKFASETDFSFEVCRDQLRALWTAYCLHNGLDCDTGRYDNALLELWHTVEESERDTADWSNFDDFDLYMGRYLC